MTSNDMKNEKLKAVAMKSEQKAHFIIKGAYWLGIFADALWAIALFSPQIFGFLTGRPDFQADLGMRGVMTMAGSLMLGWTILLLWALRNPIERRFIILLTAFPVCTGMFFIAIVEVLSGNTALLWVSIKTLVLIISMVTSYILSNRIALNTEQINKQQ